MNSKLHAVCDDHGRPVAMCLTAGQVSDYKRVKKLMDVLPAAKYMMADRGYDADWFILLLKKGLVNEILEGEMEHHIGYEKHDKSPKQVANRRNGYSQKRVTPGDDTLDLNIPRDRDAAFELQLIPKGVRQFDGFDDRVISLYARGMT